MLFGEADQLLESGRILDRHIGEHFSVQQHVRLLQRIDEPTIRESVGTNSGTDAGNPELAELPLAIFSSGVSIGLALVDGFRGSPEQTTFPSILSFRQLQSLLPSLPSFWTTFDTRHDSVLLF